MKSDLVFMTSTRRSCRLTEQMTSLIAESFKGSRCQTDLGQPRLRPENPRLERNQTGMEATCRICFKQLRAQVSGANGKKAANG